MQTLLTHGLRLAALAMALALGVVASPPADAHPRGRVHFGVWVGGPFWWPGLYGYPYVVERPVIVQPPEQPLVIQPSASQQSNNWYYCREAQMYYPHVTQCPSEWQEVPATPPPPPAPTAPPAPAARTQGTPVPAAPAR